MRVKILLPCPEIDRKNRMTKEKAGVMPAFLFARETVYGAGFARVFTGVPDRIRPASYSVRREKSYFCRIAFPGRNVHSVAREIRG